jgi:hypothetical protein
MACKTVGVSLKIIALTGFVISLLSVSSAQNLSVGGELGAGLNPAFQFLPASSGVTYINARNLSAGASAEWDFSQTVSIEADGLYRRLHAIGTPVSSFSVITWEFPVLLNYRFSTHRVMPFLEAGPSFRTTGNLNEVHPSHYGFTAGVGIERQVGRWRVAPVIRYTRWARDVQVLREDVRTRPDQLELLVGFHARSPSNWCPIGAHLSLGLVAGTNWNSDFSSTITSRVPPALANISYAARLGNATFTSSAGPRSLAAGPSVALEMPRHFSVEVQAISRPLRSSVHVVLADRRTVLELADHRSTWEFPVLGQYRGRIGRSKPFVELGPAFRLVPDVYGAGPFGVAAGAGVERRFARIGIAPGVRFTHWAQHAASASTDPRRNEIAILTAFSL